MCSTTKIRTANKLNDFYEWLLEQAHEEEYNGNERSARIYRDYAEIIRDEIMAFE